MDVTKVNILTENIESFLRIGESLKFAETEKQKLAYLRRMTERRRKINEVMDTIITDNIVNLEKQITIKDK